MLLQTGQASLPLAHCQMQAKENWCWRKAYRLPFDVSQADGALGVCCCLQWYCLWRLACGASPCSRAALPHGFLSAQHHILARETSKVLVLVWH